MHRCYIFFFFNDTATTEIYTLSLHDALPISSTFLVFPLLGLGALALLGGAFDRDLRTGLFYLCALPSTVSSSVAMTRSEEHTSELQSRQYLVCRLLLEKKKMRCGVCRYRSPS